MKSSPSSSIHWITALRRMLRFRLARRVFLVVFAAIVLIEFIIVFPSYNNFRDAQLADFEEMARVAATAALANRMPDGAELIDGMERIVAADPRIMGVSLLGPDRQVLATAGEPRPRYCVRENVRKAHR